MRILDLSLRNFRSHVKTDVNGFDNYNVITGHNASGKSTLLDAICMALTGTCRGFRHGRSMGELRHTGARNKWGIHLNVMTSPEAQKAALIKRSEGMGPRSDIQDMLGAQLGINAAAVRCCLYMSGLAELDAKDAQRLLLSVAGNGSRVAVSPEVIKALEWIGASFLDHRAVTEAGVGSMTLEDAETIHKQAYEQRRELNRVLKGAGVRPEPPADFKSELAGLKLGELIELNNKLTKLLVGKRSKHMGLIEQKAKLEAAPAALADRIKRGEARLAELERALAKCEPKAIGKATKGLMGDLNHAQEHNAALDVKMHKLNQARGEKLGAIQRVKLQIDDMEQIGVRGKCLSCGRLLTKAAAKIAVSALKKELGGHDGQLLEVEQKILKAGAAIDTSMTERKLREVKMQEERYATVVADMEKVQKALKKLGKREVPGPNTADLVERIAKLDQSITAGEERSEKVTRYAGALAHYSKLSVSQDNAQVELAQAELLVEQFGPKGPIRAQLAAGVDPFAKTLQELMGAMGFDVDLKPLLTLAKDPDPLVNGRPSRLLSDSEQLRFGVGLACALAKYTNFGVVGVDRWEILQGQTKVEVANLLNDSGHQIFVLGTLTQMDREKWLSTISQKREGWAGYYTEIENGETAVMGGA